MRPSEHYGFLRMPTPEAIGECVHEARAIDLLAAHADCCAVAGRIGAADSAWGSAVVRLLVWMLVEPVKRDGLA